MDSTLNFSLGSINVNPNLNFLNILSSNNKNDQYDFLDTNDADSPYSNSKFSCYYFHDLDFVNKYKGDKRLKILSLNMQSILSKFSEFKDWISFLDQSDCSPDIICLQELWNIPNDDFGKLPGYHPLIYTSTVELNPKVVESEFLSSLNLSLKLSHPSSLKKFANPPLLKFP